MFVWEEDAIAFIQQYHQGQAIYCLKKSGLSVCVRLSGGPCDEFLRVGCRGLNPMRKHNLSSRLAVFCWACIFADQTGHRKKSKAGSWRLYFYFLKHVCRGTVKQERVWKQIKRKEMVLKSICYLLFLLKKRLHNWFYFSSNFSVFTASDSVRKKNQKKTCFHSSLTSAQRHVWLGCCQYEAQTEPLQREI